MKTISIKTIGWVSLVISIIGVLSFIGYYISINEAPIPETIAEPTSAEVTDAIKEIIEQNEEPDTSVADTAGATATLDSVRQNGTEFAVATRSFNAVTNRFEVELLATIGDPQPGGEYLVFITDGVTSLRLGSLEKEVENTYSFIYQNENDITKLNEIVVVESGSDLQDVLQGFFE